MTYIKLFEEKKIRSQYDPDKETWYFSVIDVIEILTRSTIPKRYWSDLKKKLTNKRSQLYENIVYLKHRDKLSPGRNQKKASSHYKINS